MSDHHESRSGSGESLALPLTRDSPQLVALLKEMKDGLDVVRSKVDVLTQKVIRPIDKKLEYQTQKLIRAASNFVSEKISTPDNKEKSFKMRKIP
ncbi:hypothetical protein C4D60_Mb04t39950 [Musa balbisiana]|uniref:Syntaxin N-terminal domain-containing protein n=1 Tax=Musa balbisiana TaxID=52838 RepID=A0A4S8KI23_MUSBA|nr:hypothetical protein C4D60_Mb04t39950 [Musa balbisiana]